MTPSAVSHSVAPRAHMPLGLSPSAPSPSTAQHHPPPNRSNPSPRTTRPPPFGQSSRPPISHQSPTAVQYFLPSPGMAGASPLRKLAYPPQRQSRSPGGTWQQQQQTASPSQWQQQPAYHPTSFHPPAMQVVRPLTRGCTGRGMWLVTQVMRFKSQKCRAAHVSQTLKPSTLNSEP